MYCAEDGVPLRFESELGRGWAKQGNSSFFPIIFSLGGNGMKNVSGGPEAMIVLSFLFERGIRPIRKGKSRGGVESTTKLLNVLRIIEKFRILCNVRAMLEKLITR